MTSNTSSNPPESATLRQQLKRDISRLTFSAATEHREADFEAILQLVDRYSQGRARETRLDEVDTALQNTTGNPDTVYQHLKSRQAELTQKPADKDQDG